MFSSSGKYLNCGICNKPLSIPPIFHTSTLGNICGRCQDKGLLIEGNEDSKLSRQIIYEKIARGLDFPCAYKVLGCKLKLKWDAVSDHEAECEFRNIACPLSNENFRDPCLWTGVLENLENHIKKDHKNHFCNSLQFSITHEYESKIMFWEIMGHIVIVSMLYDEDRKRYNCSVMASLTHNDCSLYQFKVELSTNQWENPIVFQKPILEHWYGNLVPTAENGIQINVTSFEKMFEQSEEVHVKFILMKNGNQDIVSERNDVLNVLTKNDGDITVNEELLHELECPVCFEYMAPPIFICQRGHNVCGKCIEEITSCPICREEMRGGRNFILEKLTATIKYPCTNRTRGCGFVSDVMNVKEHEKNCLLSERDCIQNNCPWRGTNAELLDHIEQNHTILQIKTCNTHESSQEEKQHILIFDDKIFLFYLKFDINQPLQYAVVQCLGDHGVKYKHELQIIGCSAFDIRLTLGHLCQPVIYTKRGKDEPKKISIPFDFLCQFFTQFRQLEYKINIKRIVE